MKIKFLRNYGEYKIGDIAEFDGEELEYIVNTLTAVSVEDGFESDEIEEEQGTMEEDPELKKETSKRAKKGEK
ncbi:hypothetical protein MWF98_04770 [Fusobacterium necrophorum]|uniref:Uncharacterized protein n=1 Tax=Fusobacterium necrophorum subsp. funduliforme Fnf 1007 TaxID=1161424 RepID=A0AAN3VXX5_9FUSO|nr:MULTISPECIES: hypothetical protein [Fusobacterium]AVQ16355.1 hypothetical protein C4N16_01890 [Fusobacterium gonidiaformans ATCC 25563]EFS28928.2 hypothetical protein FGAG_01249 [Fusobacterium gonidiaformans ATCC 25563]EJU19044.1 hypothetical protein HMPREF1127_1744 [Fusobacterium necrophorum subsp. funduliforme Fnf 1007]KYM51830.1 hypothetical protein A2U04_10900 [Fusobacterium necrophorum subsp. funduliforme]MDK4474617.1 hypothetical protein [Fusobacterium necrophorum]